MDWNTFVFPAPTKSYTISHPRLGVIPNFPLKNLVQKIKESNTLSQCKTIDKILMSSGCSFHLLALHRRVQPHSYLLPC